MQSLQSQTTVVSLEVVAVILERSAGNTGSSPNEHSLVFVFDQIGMVDSRVSGRKHLCMDETKALGRHLKHGILAEALRFDRNGRTSSNKFVILYCQVTQQT